MEILGTSHVGRGIWEITGGEGVRGGVPLPHEETFAFFEFNVGDLVHTFGDILKYFNKCLSKI